MYVLRVCGRTLGCGVAKGLHTASEGGESLELENMPLQFRRQIAICKETDTDTAPVSLRKGEVDLGGFYQVDFISVS